MISAWGPAVAPALLAAVLFVVPGLVVNVALGARGFDALGLAPLTSLGVLAIGTLTVPVAVGRWSLAAVGVSLLLLTAVAVLGRVAIAWRSGGRDGDQAQLSIPGLWRAGLAHRLSSRWWAPTRRTTWWLASAGLASGIVAVNFVLGVGDPDLPSQTIDAGFHYNGVLGIIRSGFPDGGHLGATTNAMTTSWYPPLWHSVTALASSLTGVNVAIGANAVGWAIGGVVWPLSMVWLCSRILPHARLITTLALGLCCGTISLFPYLVLSFGVLWPNVLSVAALPAQIALTLMVFRLMPRAPHAQDDINSAGVAADGAPLGADEASAIRRGATVGPGLSWWTVLSVGFLGCVGMLFSHPGSLFALAIWAFIAVIMLSAQLVVRSRARGPRQLRRSLVFLFLGWSVFGVLWAAMNLVGPLNAVRDKNWPELMTANEAFGQALTLSTVITKAHWIFGAATLWGFYRLIKLPRLRWLLVSHVVLVLLYTFCAGVSGQLSRELTGFWYNDAQRLAALIPMTAVPLAALGITSAADVLARFVSRLSLDVLGRRLSSRRALGIAVVVMLALPAIFYYPGLGIGQGAVILQQRYTNPNFSHYLVAGDEQELYRQLSTQIPADQTVLGSPFTGAQFSGVWSEREVVIPHLSSNLTPDVALVAQRFKLFTFEPQVCAALKRLRVGVVIDDVDLYQAAIERQGAYPGLVGLSETPGLTPISRSASATIYRVGDCASPPLR